MQLPEPLTEIIIEIEPEAFYLWLVGWIEKHPVAFPCQGILVAPKHPTYLYNIYTKPNLLFSRLIGQIKVTPLNKGRLKIKVVQLQFGEVIPSFVHDLLRGIKVELKTPIYTGLYHDPTIWIWVNRGLPFRVVHHERNGIIQYLTLDPKIEFDRQDIMLPPPGLNDKNQRKEKLSVIKIEREGIEVNLDLKKVAGAYKLVKEENYTWAAAWDKTFKGDPIYSRYNRDTKDVAVRRAKKKGFIATDATDSPIVANLQVK